MNEIKPIHSDEVFVIIIGSTPQSNSIRYGI